MRLKLEAVLAQKIILSQEMLQSLNILSCSTEELHSLLKAKQERNPFLKIQYNHANHIELLSNEKDSTFDFTQNIMEQLLHIKVSKRLIYIIKLILADLSEIGFLNQSPKEMAINFRSSMDEIQEALSLLRQCEPEGLGCRNLQEFLIRQSQYCPEKVKNLLENYYELFLHQKWNELTQQTGYSSEEINEVCMYVSQMKTRPLAETLCENMYIRPDISIVIIDGKLKAKFHEHAFPRTFFDYDFEKGLAENKEVKMYLEIYCEEAKNLKEQLESRKETMRKIIDEIIDRQIDFFYKGPGFLKSLTMTEIAQSLDIHVSTISRAVREKYISTPYGTFAVRHFFTKSNQFLDENKMTVNQVKKYILSSIDSEDRRNPISDQEIVNRLKDQGIQISRRVIAKYREQMNVPASFKRKKLFFLKSGCF